ncbi:MAG: nitroreductase family protein [Planctomycetes bacterium]|nr:nitroreductase family protein [Planctomycetota bacterium]
MNTLEAIRARRSVKHYDPDHVMPEQDLQLLLEHAVLSPTSFNIQNWRFLVVRDKALRQQIRAAAWNQAQVTDASVLIVMCADLQAWKHDPVRYWRDAPAPLREMLAPMIEPFYAGKPELQRDEAMRSMGFAGQTLMLAAKALGYDSNPMIGFDPQKVAELIRLPKDHVIGFLLPIGKALKPANPRGGQLALQDVVVHDRFPA